ncbi:kinase-like protein, partial [Bimuria novae-zelandiae CBS 107.79]
KGRTAIIYRWEGGLVCKIPWTSAPKHLELEFERAIVNEKNILEKLRGHPGIIEYHGLSSIEGMKDGLLFSEANRGDLQSYIDRENSYIDYALRKKWCFQVANAVAYVQENGVIHMNLSTTNVLLHQTDQTIDAILADFGGSRCSVLGLSGNMIPDDPYLDPQLTEFNLPKVDVFSLGVIIYIIMTGHYPFHERPAPENEEMHTYGERVQDLYRDGKFPDVSSVPFGDVIAGCCCERRFETAKEVVVVLEA